MEKINTLMYINGFILLLEIHHRFDFLVSNSQKKSRNYNLVFLSQNLN